MVMEHTASPALSYYWWSDISVVCCAIVREQQGLATLPGEPVAKGDRNAGKGSGLTGNGKVPQYLNKVEQIKSSDSN